MKHEGTTVKEEETGKQRRENGGRRLGDGEWRVEN